MDRMTQAVIEVDGTLLAATEHGRTVFTAAEVHDLLLDLRNRLVLARDLNAWELELQRARRPRKLGG